VKSREWERVETDLRRQARVSCLQSVKMPGVLTSALRREVGGFKGFLKVEEKGEGGRRKREREQSLSRKTPRKLRSDDDDEAFVLRATRSALIVERQPSSCQTSHETRFVRE